jgi:hypothetical protein
MDKLDFPPLLESAGREFQARILNFPIDEPSPRLSPEMRREGGKALKKGVVCESAWRAPITRKPGSSPGFRVCGEPRFPQPLGGLDCFS